MSDRVSSLRGSKVYLRPLERTDLNETYLRWVNDPEVTRYMETGTFPSTMHDLEKFYQGVTGSKSDVIFAIADRKTHRHVGNVKLGPINWVHRNAMFGIMIGDKGLWGSGVGEEVTRLIADYAFQRLNLNRLTLGVFAEHESAVRCYEKVGFRVEGRIRQDLFLEGEYKDRLWMGLLHSDYKPLRAGKRK